QAVLLDRLAPAVELFFRKPVTRAGVFHRQQAAANRSNHFCLTPDNPARGARRRQIVQSERIPIGTHHHPIISALLLHGAFLLVLEEPPYLGALKKRL